MHDYCKYDFVLDMDTREAQAVYSSFLKGGNNER